MTRPLEGLVYCSVTGFGSAAGAVTTYTAPPRLGHPSDESRRWLAEEAPP